MFRRVPLSIIRSFTLYTQQTCIHIPLLRVQWKTDDGLRNCPKHAEYYTKNKFEKLVQLVGFIIRIFHDERSSELQILMYIYCSQSLCNLEYHCLVGCDPVVFGRHVQMFRPKPPPCIIHSN